MEKCADKNHKKSLYFIVFNGFSAVSQKVLTNSVLRRLYNFVSVCFQDHLFFEQKQK
jgi:hypothetical protein